MVNLEIYSNHGAVEAIQFLKDTYPKKPKD